MLRSPLFGFRGVGVHASRGFEGLGFRGVGFGDDSVKKVGFWGEGRVWASSPKTLHVGLRKSSARLRFLRSPADVHGHHDLLRSFLDVTLLRGIQLRTCGRIGLSG